MAKDLGKLSRLIWGLIGGGALLFVVSEVLLSYALPDAPANRLIKDHFWVFIPSVAMVMTGIYLGARYWRCPYCKAPIGKLYPIPRRCPRCGRDVSL
jgi:predicted cobalt transporter CbtA